MISVIKLIYINLLNLFDINIIIVARDSGVRSNNEKKLIIFGIIVVVYSYLIYKIFQFFSVNNPLNILRLGFGFASMISFGVSLLIVSSTIFKSNDIDLLFSLPLSKKQIIFSKLFSVYIINLIFVIVVMLISSISYYNVSSIDQSLALMLVMSSVLIPVIPIILCSILSYINSYIKVNYNYFIKILYRTILLGIVSGSIYFIKNPSYLYPTYGIYNYMISNNSNLVFILFIIINILLLFLYSIIISNNYSKICSLLKGVRKKSFNMKKMKNKKNIIGFIKKELLVLVNNNNYFNNVILFRLLFSVLLLLVYIFIPYEKLSSVEYFNDYFNWFMIPFLCFCSSFSTFNISSISIEKKCLYLIKTLPVKFNKILFSKLLCGLLIGLMFILFNGLFTIIYFNTNLFMSIMIIVCPLCFMLFMEMMSLVLDYRFVLLNEMNDNVILKQRVISYIPMLISLLLLVFIFVIFGLGKYWIMILGISVIFIILFLGFLIYLLFVNKKLYRNLK